MLINMLVILVIWGRQKLKFSYTDIISRSFHMSANSDLYRATKTTSCPQTVTVLEDCGRNIKNFNAR